MMKSLFLPLTAGSFAMAVMLSPVAAQSASSRSDNLTCPFTHSQLRTALKNAVEAKGTNQMWGVVVNRTGVVCAVAYSGPRLTSQWLLSRQIAAAKAFTTNGLSNSPAQKFTTANLYAATQPGGPLFGLAAGNPVDPEKAYREPQSRWGTAKDPMVGEIVGGTITFGGGTPLQKGGRIVGGVGVSGDTADNDQRVSDAVAAAL